MSACILLFIGLFADLVLHGGRGIIMIEKKKAEPAAAGGYILGKKRYFYMKKNKVGNTPMDAALKYLTSKARTVREMEDHLDSLNYGEYEVYQVVERLKELNYLNDEKYAADFVSSRLAAKPLSRRKLQEQLYAHKLPKDAIETALSGITAETEAVNALQVAEKFARQFEALPVEEQKNRTMRRLVGRGFAYDASRSALETVFGSAEGLESCVGGEDDED